MTNSDESERIALAMASGDVFALAECVAASIRRFADQSKETLDNLNRLYPSKHEYSQGYLQALKHMEGVLDINDTFIKALRKRMEEFRST